MKKMMINAVLAIATLIPSFSVYAKERFNTNHLTTVNTVAHVGLVSVGGAFVASAGMIYFGHRGNAPVAYGLLAAFGSLGVSGIGLINGAYISESVSFISQLSQYEVEAASTKYEILKSQVRTFEKTSLLDTNLENELYFLQCAQCSNLKEANSEMSKLMKAASKIAKFTQNQNIRDWKESELIQLFVENGVTEQMIEENKLLASSLLILEKIKLEHN